MTATPATDSLPRIWNIREERNLDFVGREAELEHITRDLSAQGIAFLNEDSPPVGGLGKTYIAREYAYRHAGEYQVVWWVQAQELGVLHFGYAQLMTALNLLAGVPDGTRHTVAEAREYLSSHKGWLLILDGLEERSAIEQLLPTPGAGHVIVTTLLGAASLPHSAIPISSLSADESRDFLETRLQDITSEDVDAITAQLNHSPLILDLMSKYIAGSRIRPQEALEALSKMTPAPLREDVTQDVYKGVLRILVGMVLDRLYQLDPAARDLARLCSFMGPHDIPLFLLNQQNDGLSKRLSDAVADESAFDSCLDALAAFGLIERHASSISMHEIVQEAIREQLAKEPLRAWSGAAVRLIGGVFPYQPEYKQPISECSRLLSHGLAATQYAQEAGVSKENSALLLYQVGLYLYERGALLEAKTCYLLSISIGHQVYGVTHPTFATRINSLGVVEHELGNLVEAKGCFEKAFEVCEALFGPLHEAVYTAEDDAMLTMPIRNLCGVLEELGDVGAAQSTYERAMKIYLEVYGWNHPMVAECANQFGMTWHRLGRWAKARNCFEKAVLAEESCADADGVNLALYLNNLATVLMEVNEPDLARERLERALRLDRLAYDGQHPALARDLANLGNACRILRRSKEAEDYYKEALSIIDATGEEHSRHNALLLNHLGVVLIDNGNPAGALTALEEALALNTERHGAGSKESVRNLINLGRAYDELKKHEEAMERFTRALRIVEGANGEESERQATIIYRIGRSHHAHKQFDEANKCLHRAMKIDTDLFGQQHPAVARDAFAIGNLLADMDDSIVAMGHLTLALDIYENTLGKDNAKTRSVRKRLDELST